MTTLGEVQDMIALLDENIREHGWDASVAAAHRTLLWVMAPERGAANPWRTSLEEYMRRAWHARRAEWIARGGDPEHWPILPPVDNPVDNRTDYGAAHVARTP